jgi:peroxin-12
MLPVERHYLLTYYGSFTENFYSLKREKALLIPSIPRASIAAPSHVRKAFALSSTDI